MVKLNFLESLDAMRTIFSEISAIASSLMQVNTISIVPTEEESAQLQASYDEIADHIRQLKIEAQEKIETYNARKESSAVSSEASMKEYAQMQESLILLEKENAEARIALAQKNAEKEEYEMACRKSERELADISRRRDEEISKSKKKKKDLNKWFWVPGYGLYLAIDTLVNELNNEIGSLTRRLEEERRRRDTLDEQYRKISREVEERNQRAEMIRDRMTDINGQMEQQTAVLASCKEQLLYWEDFHMQIARLESKLRSGERSPETLYEVVELMEAFEAAGTV